MSKWSEAQKWEQDWHGLSLNTFGEEEKQLLYADRMGLQTFHNGKSPYNFDLGGVSVVDVGGGPASLLLKCTNYEYGVVIDPMHMPRWVLARYEQAPDLCYWKMCGEELFSLHDDYWTEAWIYNCLQHTENPQLVIAGAQRVADIVRVFEWIDVPTSVGHIHTLTENKLNEWLGGEGKVEQFTGQAGCKGRGYYGVFPTS